MMDTRSALDVASEYLAGLSERDADRMDAVRSEEFYLDFIHGDAFENHPLSQEDTRMFWPNWFVAFPELDIEVTRTIAAEEVVVVQWNFTGTNSGPLQRILGKERIEPTGNTVRLRGVTFLDILDGLIRRETTYIDIATLMVELGVQP